MNSPEDESLQAMAKSTANPIIDASRQHLGNVYAKALLGGGGEGRPGGSSRRANWNRSFRDVLNKLPQLEPAQNAASDA